MVGEVRAGRGWEGQARPGQARASGLWSKLGVRRCGTQAGAGQAGRAGRQAKKQAGSDTDQLEDRRRGGIAGVDRLLVLDQGQRQHTGCSAGQGSTMQGRAGDNLTDAQA